MMSITTAFKYPFKHFAEVFALALVLTIALAVFLGLALNSYDWSPILADIYDLDPTVYIIGEREPLHGTALLGIFGALAVIVVEGFWLSGYSIEVIRAVMHEVESLPNIDFSRNLIDGFYLFLSSVAYWAVLVVILAITMFVNNLTRSEQTLNAVLMFPLILLTLAAVALMGWAYLIGMARFAAEGDFRASWEIRANLRRARQNWRTGVELAFHMALLMIAFGFCRGIVDGLFGGVSGMFGLTLSIVIVYFFNLFQHFSTQNLIAQFASEVGIRSDYYAPEKDKHGYV